MLFDILAVPDEWMDASVIEGLHIVGNLGTDENFDQLLDVARRNFIEVDVESTAADLAARIWLEAPQAMELKEREAGSKRRRKFESFRAREPEKVLPPEQLPMQFDELEANMEGWFMAKNRGVGCRVIRGFRHACCLGGYADHPQPRADRRSAFVRYRFTDAGLSIRRTFAGRVRRSDGEGTGG